jgi:hypothetical protein
MQWAHNELQESIAEFANLARMADDAKAIPAQTAASQRPAQTRTSPPVRAESSATQQPVLDGKHVALLVKRVSKSDDSKRSPAMASQNSGAPSTPKLLPLTVEIAALPPPSSRAASHKPAAASAVQRAGATSAFKSRQLPATSVSKS